jgi:hypothetical protein
VACFGRSVRVPRTSGIDETSDNSGRASAHGKHNAVRRASCLPRGVSLLAGSFPVVNIAHVAENALCFGEATPHFGAAQASVENRRS